MHSSVQPTWILSIPFVCSTNFHSNSSLPDGSKHFYPHISILKELSQWCHSKTSTPIRAWNYNIPKYGHVSRGWRLQDKVGIWKQTGNEWQSNRNLGVKKGWECSYRALRNYYHTTKYLGSAGSWSTGEIVFHQCK